MNTTVLLHPSPGAGFDAPFEMLLECHQRVERMLRLLERLAAHLVASGCDADARSAARDVMRYFDLAGPAHHEDEERHVLPALAADADADLQALAARLHQDHLEMAQQWQALRADLAAVEAGERCVPGDRAADFASLYRAHIVAEESLAYPAVRSGLGETALASIGAEMAARRGLHGAA